MSNKTSEIIDKAIATFEGVIRANERFIYDETIESIKMLNLDSSGKIKPSIENIKILTRIKKNLSKLLSNKKYLKGVEQFVSEFDNLYKEQINYFIKISGKMKPSKKYYETKRIAIDNTISNLTGAGLQSIVTDKINDILLRAVTSGVRYSDLTKELYESLNSTDKGSGLFSKYATTYATTAISQYAGENNKLMTSDLGLEWFEYVGSNIENTREFCEHLTEKRYIHKSEIHKLLKGDIDGYQCEIYEKTGLPKGMIDGTNEENFQVNCGGWNCRHQLVPVAKEAVPLDIRSKIK